MLLRLSGQLVYRPGRDMLARRLLAEFLGTGLLVVAVVGSGIMAARLSPNDVGLELLENAVATAAALVAIILCLAPVSGAHLNPAVTLAAGLLKRTEPREQAGYIAAQVTGGIVMTPLIEGEDVPTVREYARYGVVVDRPQEDTMEQNEGRLRRVPHSR